MLRGETAESMDQGKQKLVLIAVLLGIFVSHFTAGVMNVALPELMNVFQVSLGSVQWVTVGYLLVIATFLPLMGKLGDRFGLRTIHNLGYLTFLLSSFLLALSPDFAVLLLLRVVQAIGAAMYQATNVALIAVHFPKNRIGRALGTVSTAVALGAMSGPVIGGMVAEWLGWRWLFLIHVPVSIVATVLAYVTIPKEKTVKTKEHFPLVSIMLFMLMIGSLIYGMSNGNQYGWLSAPTTAVLAMSIASLLMLMLWERRQKTPFLPLHTCKNPMVASGMVVTFASYAAANTTLAVTPFYLTGFLEMPTALAGYLMIAYPMVLALAGPIAGRMSDRYGPKRLTLAGLGLMGAGTLLFALFYEHTSVVFIAIMIGMVGAGMGLTATPNLSLIMKHAPAHESASISGMVGMIRNVGMVFGAAMGLGMLNGAGDGARITDYSGGFGLSALVCLISVMIFLYGERLASREKPISIERESA
ncbi:MFS transporter [Brevibacillus invocatus]|uniref:MFS transporter n=1 Tax=Brevibacillus invocatus TaxID=173959 RepID=UPI00203D1666|nr:MFS transporter [Brevibacillus invocatus]MCM3080705.1 MFS transporter [Brevibacillus invocatus]MCM3430874.1 MFS transporter [Brevibacillus invocatus]